MLTGPSNSPPLTIRLIDLLLPQRLLAEMHADENPLLTHSRRAQRRWHRLALTVIIEALILLLLYEIIYSLSLSARNWPATGEFVPSFFFHWFQRQRLTSGYFPLVVFYGFGLLLLLQLLRLNDHSSHLKKLSHENLTHLLQTPMQADDYFTQHLLTFCLRYRIIIYFALALMLRVIAELIRPGDYALITGEFYRALCSVLALILFAWLGGVFQYIWEWRHFAGGSRSGWFGIASRCFSVLIVIPVALLSYVAYRAEHPLVAPFLCGVLFLGGLFWIQAYGMQTREIALDVLRSRMAGRDPDDPGAKLAVRFVALGLLNPLYWFRQEAELRAVKARLRFPGRGPLLDCALLGTAFAAVFFLISLYRRILFDQYYFDIPGYYLIQELIAETLVAWVAFIFAWRLIQAAGAGGLPRPHLLLPAANPLAGLVSAFSALILTLVSAGQMWLELSRSFPAGAMLQTALYSLPMLINAWISNFALWSFCLLFLLLLYALPFAQKSFPMRLCVCIAAAGCVALSWMLLGRLHLKLVMINFDALYNFFGYDLLGSVFTFLPIELAVYVFLFILPDLILYLLCCRFVIRRLDKLALAPHLDSAAEVAGASQNRARQQAAQ